MDLDTVVRRIVTGDANRVRIAPTYWVPPGPLLAVTPMIGGLIAYYTARTRSMMTHGSVDQPFVAAVVLATVVGLAVAFYWFATTKVQFVELRRDGPRMVVAHCFALGERAEDVTISELERAEVHRQGITLETSDRKILLEVSGRTEAMKQAMALHILRWARDGSTRSEPVVDAPAPSEEERRHAETEVLEIRRHLERMRWPMMLLTFEWAALGTVLVALGFSSRNWLLFAPAICTCFPLAIAAGRYALVASVARGTPNGIDRLAEEHLILWTGYRFAITGLTGVLLLNRMSWSNLLEPSTPSSPTQVLKNLVRPNRKISSAQLWFTVSLFAFPLTSALVYLLISATMSVQLRMPVAVFWMVVWSLVPFPSGVAAYLAWARHRQGADVNWRLWTERFWWVNALWMPAIGGWLFAPRLTILVLRALGLIRHHL